MKKFITLSAAALASAAAFAGPTFDKTDSAPVVANFSTQRAEMPALDLRPMQLKGYNNHAVVAKADRAQAPATKFGAYYGFGDGTYHTSLIWDGGFYSYSYAIAQGYPYAAKFDAILGDKWSMKTASETIDLTEYVDEDGNLVLSDFGLGAFYMPTIKNRTKSYTYGSNNSGQILCNATWNSDYPLSMFDANELESFYGGVNTGEGQGYAYGSSTAYGPSGETIIDYGKVGGPLAVQNVSMWLTTEDVIFATDDDYITVTLEDKISEDSTAVYTAYIREENIESAGNSTCAIASFTEEDEDGFEIEITPVLHGEVTLRITNTDGCDYGIIMAASEMEDVDANNRSLYPCSTYWYYGGNDMEQGYYRWQGADGVVYLTGHYNALLAADVQNELPAGVGYVDNTCAVNTTDNGEKYQWAVGLVQEGKGYNDFMVSSTFSCQDDTIQIYASEELLGFDVEDQYFEDENIIAYYFAVAPLPAGVESRVIPVTLISNGEAEYTINIYQTSGVYDPSSIDAVVTENKQQKVYNLQGQLTNESGLVVKNGKVVFIKK